ncbi:MAG TPA: hypothetical protein ENN41_01800 [Sediminispirochaeta sp.]|nr:hypothetical protein [Sediminispirochaeta sp.]
MKQVMTCHCGKEIEFDVPDSFNIADEPRLIEEIIDGSFMELECESCGAKLRPDIPLLFERISTTEGKIRLRYIPEPQRTRYLGSKLSEDDVERWAIGYEELREKFLIFSHQLDDRLIEFIKFLLLEKAESAENVRIVLAEIEEDHYTFYIHGLREQEVGISKIPRSLYQKVLASLTERMQNEVYSQIAEPPYVSINKISLEEEDL